MTRLAIVCVALAAVAAGCGSHRRSAATATASCGSSVTSSELRIREVRVANAPRPIEGEISYLRLRRPDGAKIVDTELSPSGAAFRCRVSPGRYVVAVWHRYCDANCGTLDPISDRCSGVVAVRARATVRVTIRNRPGSPCGFVVGSVS